MKADIELCYKYLHELCQIVWAGGNHKPKMTMRSIPPQPDNFDMQLSAAFDELKAYREKHDKILQSIDEWRTTINCSATYSLRSLLKEIKEMM